MVKESELEIWSLQIPSFQLIQARQYMFTFFLIITSQLSMVKSL
jgi:hypothetical protein